MERRGKEVDTGLLDCARECACRVILCDEHKGSLQKIITIIEAAEAYPISIERISDLRKPWAERSCKCQA